jgi:ribosomal protein S27E
MAIEFRCTQCHKLLRIGDDAAGKQAKCPECGAILPVPAAGAALPVVFGVVRNIPCSRFDLPAPPDAQGVAHASGE